MTSQEIQTLLSKSNNAIVGVNRADGGPSHKYVVAYGRAEIIERNVGELTRPILEKYVPADQLEQSVKMLGNDPTRVLVVLHPQKMVTN